MSYEVLSPIRVNANTQSSLWQNIVSHGERFSHKYEDSTLFYFRQKFHHAYTFSIAFRDIRI
ncbi:uncharacterized protein LOC143153171 isoform X3 [Ptiloglossa arizonensis]|uniref:uncharacterized protein LOC143153171 isoform X3 n=1 Tax=Ptiloglossa arizonensis TaxID=3350558 RepID=UPI003F9F78BD